jgi:hypothetical protein
MIRTTWIKSSERDYTTLFDREPFTFIHQLAGHPLLSLHRLDEIARGISADTKLKI